LTSIHLVPSGFLRGEPAEQAVAAGLAYWLAGGPCAFTAVTALWRSADGSGLRKPLPLAEAQRLYPEHLQRLSAVPQPWVGFDLKRPLIMGIVNVTPDSFSDGGDHADTEGAVRFGEALLAAGADILDIGGESTRPGAPPVPLDEELERVVPIVEALRAVQVPISVDTYKPAVMRAALDAGADMINDIWGLRREGALDAERLKRVLDGEEAAVAA